MNIRWIGHACFYITSAEARILTDPFAAKVPYRFPEIEADIVTVSHQHHDHNAISRVKGAPVVIDSSGTTSAHGVTITGLPSFHDDAHGAKRGSNLIFRFHLEGICVAHLGDLGADLGAKLQEQLSDVEVLMIPVGGYYTIDAAQAAAIVRSLPHLRIVLPMHYRTAPIADWPIAPVDDFLQTMDNVRQIGRSETLITKETLPEALEVRILDHA